MELVCTIGEVSSIKEEDVSQDESLQSRAKLTFTNRNWIYYSDEGISYTTVEVIKHYNQTTTYEAQSYTSSVNPYIVLSENRLTFGLNQI